jgi:hypothetical protein
MGDLNGDRNFSRTSWCLQNTISREQYSEALVLAAFLGVVE